VALFHIFKEFAALLELASRSETVEQIVEENTHPTKLLLGAPAAFDYSVKLPEFLGRLLVAFSLSKGK